MTPAPLATDVFRLLSKLPGCLFLDSALEETERGRYSFVAADPYDWIFARPSELGVFERLKNSLAGQDAATLADLPPFQGGMAGLFSYDLNRSLERLGAPRWDEFQTPALAVGFYDVVVAFDHRQGRAWIISQGTPETEPAARHDRAAARLERFHLFIEGTPPTLSERAGASAPSRLPIDRLSPQYPLSWFEGLTSDFSPEGYRSAVRMAIDAIHAGDAFQVNLSQRLLIPHRESAVDFHLRLRHQNRAPFASYFDWGTGQLSSSSPERFLKVSGRQVETRPIKGTRPRGRNPVQDAQFADELRLASKDRAENTMIVDLLRNDLSRVCVDDSITVPTLCGLESYQHVHHLVSVVRGELRPEATPLDLLRAAFPGGSITGAPKVRAMEIIAELEPTARGAYCGTLAYVGFNGAMDSSILIRTTIVSHGWMQVPVGGGVVADSDPDDEYDETRQKAIGMLQSLPT